MSFATLLAGPVETAARGLIGARVRSDIGGERTVVAITETEAYGSDDDPASHAYRGPTDRNAAMFGPPGTAYVYLAYGIHWCLNVATGPVGEGGAVLLRGAAPLEGEEVMRIRRGRPDHLLDGPGKLAQALGVTRAIDGTDLLAAGVVSLVPAEAAPPAIVSRTRVGISVATERRWRFVAVG